MAASLGGGPGSLHPNEPVADSCSGAPAVSTPGPRRPAPPASDTSKPTPGALRPAPRPRGCWLRASLSCLHLLISGFWPLPPLCGSKPAPLPGKYGSLGNGREHTSDLERLQDRGGAALGWGIGCYGGGGGHSVLVFLTDRRVTLWGEPRGPATAPVALWGAVSPGVQPQPSFLLPVRPSWALLLSSKAVGVRKPLNPRNKINGQSTEAELCGLPGGSHGRVSHSLVPALKVHTGLLDLRQPAQCSSAFGGFGSLCSSSSRAPSLVTIVNAENERGTETETETETDRERQAETETQRRGGGVLPWTGHHSSLAGRPLSQLLPLLLSSCLASTLQPQVGGVGWEVLFPDDSR